MDQTKKVLFLAAGFMIIGFLVVFLTHENPINKTVENPNLVSAENYMTHIKPWLGQIYTDQSLDNISEVKEKFLNLKSADKSVGSAHLALFLALDAWEKFLLTGDEANKQISIKNFSTASQLLPDLALEIESLSALLTKQNV